jgi:hypothetical protein
MLAKAIQVLATSNLGGANGADRIMNSGEKVKPPATQEERNPFDISRRSGTEVAVEIANRMAAWKQARGRSYATQSTVPSGDAKQAPIAAPVQPARMPNLTDRAAQPSQAQSRPTREREADAPPAQRPRAAAAAGSGEARAPFLASFSIRRAMPPAPSLKPAAPPLRTSDASRQSMEPATANPRHDPEGASGAKAITVGEAQADIQADIQTDIPATPVSGSDAHASEPVPARAHIAETDERSIPASPPASVPESQRHSIETRENEEPQVAAASKTESVAPDTPAKEFEEPPIAASAAAASKTESGAPVAEGGDIELRRAKARDMRARWIKAHDLDSPHIAVTPPAEMAEAKGAEPARPGIAAQDRADIEVSGVSPAVPAIEALDQATVHREPARDAPLGETRQIEDSGTAAPAVEGRDTGALEADRRTLRTAAIPAVEALDEMLGRREPTFDEPIATRRIDVAATGRSTTGEHEIGAPRVGAPGIEHPAPHTPDTAFRAPGTEAFEEAAPGRKEPTFDPPIGEKRKIEAAAPTPAAAETAEARRRIELRAIETRIEARRIDTLRADPQLAVRQSMFPHIEQEEWDVPFPVAARARRGRGGTGWAIGLGAALLIAGITAPAAIWQQQQQGSPTDQDQVAMVNPLPPPPEKSQPPAPATAQATLPAAPQPEAPQPAVPVQESPPTKRAAAQVQESSSAASLPAPVVKPDLGEATPEQREEQATLGAVGSGGDVNEAPVVAPAPVDNLAGETQPSVEPAQTTTSLMVARPFMPEQPAPFLRAPTAGSASVAVDGTNPAVAPRKASIAVDGASPAGARMGAQAGAQLSARAASTAPKPRLMGQLKPVAPALNAPAAAPQKQITRKPRPFFQQTPEQMFQTLVDTLSEGKPGTKPPAPSNRK